MQTYKLSSKQELRLYLPPGTHASITIRSGAVEVLGVEWSQGFTHKLHSSFNLPLSLPIYTWEGASIDIERDSTVGVYIHEDSQMMKQCIDVYTNLHSIHSSCGILVVGSQRSGRHSVSRLLANYAVRQYGGCVLMDLDGSCHIPFLSHPFCVSAAFLKLPFCPEIVDSSKPETNIYGWIEPLSYPSGGLHDPLVFRNSLQQLVENARKESGGWVASLTSDEANIAIAIDVLKPTRVVVLDNDALAHRLPNSISLQKSGGVIGRSPNERRSMIYDFYRSYFYGPCKSFQPVRKVFQFTELSFLTLTGKSLAPKDTLPLQSEPREQKARAIPFQPNIDLVNQVVAISSFLHPPEKPPSPEHLEHIRNSSILGYAHIQEVRFQQKQYVLLLPNQTPLPSRYLLVFHSKWNDI